jgi:hypothetical protein
MTPPQIPTTEEEYQDFLRARGEYLSQLIQAPTQWARDHHTFTEQRETFWRFTRWGYLVECIRWKRNYRKVTNETH